jgi:hypothetical protein
MDNHYEEGEYHCEHCGKDRGIYFDDDGIEWCPACAYANGIIDEHELDFIESL